MIQSRHSRRRVKSNRSRETLGALAFYKLRLTVSVVPKGPHLVPSVQNTARHLS